MIELLDSASESLWCVAIVGIAVIAYLVYRVRRPATGPTQARRYAPAPQGGPQPRERWWADFPHQDDPSQSKARPCYVLGYSGRGYWVLKSTTQAPKNPEWRVPVNAARWSPPADKNGYVDLVPYHLPRGLLKRRQGVLSGTKTAREIESRVRWDRAWDFIG
ncbi:hypothetical protein [Glycomyces sp. NPDC048151]|uniref:hypothetical protein n=1 Tax=Glycomyces sp. NPDC048151 TaxID=3364002 RepID=UPI003723AAD4